MISARIAACGVLLLVLSTVILSYQDESCESKTAELERRIKILERHLGISQASSSETYNASVRPSPAVSQPVQNKSLPEPEPQTLRTSANRAYPIAVMLVEKSLQEKGPGEESDRLGFQFEFRNCGKEHVTSFSGVIDIHSQEGEFLQSFKFDIATYVTVGDKTTWYVSIPFSNVNAGHRLLYSTEITGLNAILKLRQVMYYDTRIENFE